MRLAALLLIALPLHAGELYVSWTNPTTDARGNPFAPGEFQGTRVHYAKHPHDSYTYDVEGESIRISGLKKGWWEVYLVSLSQCQKVYEGEEVRQLNQVECQSDPTPTMRVKVQ